MSIDKTIQFSNGDLLHQLHHNGKLLVLPNIWDSLGSKLLESMGYSVIATASASIAFSNGYTDGERIPYDELLTILQKIVKSVKIPVTADIESGYAKNKIALKENIKKLVDIGIAGINFEDSSHEDNKLISSEQQCERISIIKKTADEKGVRLFINARTDVYIKATETTNEEKLSETIRRGKAYQEGGADGFYPILLKNSEEIESVIKEVNLPINILLLPGIPDFEGLKRLGVARLSLGPGFLKTAVNAMKNIAEKLLHHEGMKDVTDNPITSTFLNNLISHE